MSDRKLLGMLGALLQHGAGADERGDAGRRTEPIGAFRALSSDRDLLAPVALDQFQFQPMLEAAALLADAKVDSICWNGTSASWLVLDTDRSLCSTIEARTGIGATSAVLALEQIFRQSGIKRFGLVSPYLSDVQSRIIVKLRGEGFECVAERHCGLSDNFSFSAVTSGQLSDMIREVATERPQAITLLCTNLRGASLVERLEQELGLPIYDSVAVALWGSLRAADVEPGCIRGWGSLFRDIR